MGAGQSATRHDQGKRQSSPVEGPNGGQVRPSPSLTRRDWFAPPSWMENPFGMMRRCSEEMDRIFDEFGMGRGLFSSHSDWRREQGQGMWSPQIEVYERDNQLIVFADLPGMKKEDIQLEITDNALELH